MNKLAQIAFIILSAFLITQAAVAADYPPPKQAVWTAKDFRFHSGDVLPELRIGYTTIGDPGGEPVLLMHGSGSNASYFLTKQYAEELFRPGQPLDATKYFLILPDGIGSGRTSKPSDGMRTKFPKYNYVDMVHAQYRLLTEGLGVKHVRLVSGNSMGGMEAWLFAELYPDFMDGVVPLASTPAKMSGRNWLTRRLLIETIKTDPEYQAGEYAQQPQSMKLAFAWFGLTTNGGNLALVSRAADSAAGDQIVRRALEAPLRGDANDLIYQYEASADYDAWSALAKITVPVLAINSEDDERNPADLQVLERAARQNPKISYFVIKTSPETRGHSTSGNAKLWKAELATFLASLPRR
ncbi:MAG: alpha/beta fold hydrolase [Beijerinckiaceae bacterium]